MPKPNYRIGPYQLINRLGKGSFGEVWLAQPENAKSPPVAVKLSNDPDLDVNALLQEVKVWARAGKHPNVVEFLDAQVYDQQAVIVSEYVPDGSLEQWLRRHGGRAPSMEAAIEMIDGILAGLEYLHSISIIHRDLKPANILMHGNTPRLADFGHSRVLASTMHSSVIAGTPAYMAPEAFDAVRNEQTDVWSIGVLLYQMLAGQMPFPQRDSASLMKAILMTEPQPLPAELPRWLRQVVEKALSKDTTQRFKSAKEMRAALRQSVVSPVRQTAEVIQPEIEETTIGRGKVMVDISPTPKPPPPIQTPPKREPVVTTPLPKLKPQLAKSNSGKWLGAGLVAIILAAVGYLATKTDYSKMIDNNQALPNPGDEFTENLNGVKLVMKRLPGGEFMMGSPDNEEGLYDNERPQHRVTVPSFYIGKTEVTQAQWRKVAELPKVFMDLRHDPSYFKGDDLPVETVSYWEAREFCTRLSRLTGKTYRLPSEAEWEYACRAGTTGAYAGDLDAMAWYSGNAGSKTHPVGRKQPNRFDLYDMHGNVWEWCEDVWHNRYGGQHGAPPSDGSAWLSGGDSSYRVLRGGSLINDGDYCRSAYRNYNQPGDRSVVIGFRVVVSARTRNP